MATILTEDALMAAILKEVKRVTDEAATAAIAKAQREVEMAVRGSVDKIALRIASHYSIIDNQNRILIEVRKMVEDN